MEWVVVDGVGDNCHPHNDPSVMTGAGRPRRRPALSPTGRKQTLASRTSRQADAGCNMSHLAIRSIDDEDAKIYPLAGTKS